MARLFNDAASDFLSQATAVLTAVPITMACWFYPDDVALSQEMVAIGNGAGTDYFALNFNGAAAGDPLRALSRQGGAVSAASTSAGVNGAANAWYHGCAVFSASNARAVYFNGGSVGTNATSSTPASLTRTVIGTRANADNTAYFSGRLAEVAIWSVALSAGEVAALAGGISPPYIQPLSIVGYWPVWGLHSPEIDLTANNRQMTVSGTALANHAPVTPFSSRIWGTMPFQPAIVGPLIGAGHLLRNGPLIGGRLVLQ